MCHASVCDYYRLVWVGCVTIDILPDYVLLLIFHFDRLLYFDEPRDSARVRRLFWKWHRLVHVSQRWRCVVFRSPNFLDVRLVCGPRTPLELTGIWPPLPIIIINLLDASGPIPEGYDFNAAIVHHNSRICQIDLFYLTRSQLRRLVSAAMRVQFPALIHLQLESFYYCGLVLPDGFLGGSVPRLQTLELKSIAFPALPELLLTATRLVHLTRGIFPLPGTFHPRQSSLAWLCRPTSNLSLLYLNLLGLSPTWKGDVHCRQHTPSSQIDSILITFFHQPYSAYHNSPSL